VNEFLFSSDFMARKTEEFWGAGTFQWGKLRNPFNSPAMPESRAAGKYILFVGRFVEEKGAAVLICAAALVPDVPVVLVGSGPEESALRELADSLGASNVVFVGPRWGPDLDEFLDKACCVVVPSVWHENYPYVVLQSYARGKPVIGAERGGIPELVTSGETGLLFDPDDVESLAESIQRLWNDPQTAREMGHVAKMYCDSTFNPRTFTEELTGCYERVLG
jgi:glycosyltransferase involved in cell wall biosynthesis